jgi:hypothetical protein
MDEEHDQRPEFGRELEQRMRLRLVHVVPFTVGHHPRKRVIQSCKQLPFPMGRADDWMSRMRVA